MKALIVLLVSLSFFNGLASAGQMNALPTCYGQVGLPSRADPSNTELFVAIDQTTPLDNVLKQSIADNIRPLLRPGFSFSVYQFSAYTQGKYADLIVSGQLDGPLTPAQRDDIGKPVLAKFDRCMALQRKKASQLVGLALRQTLDGIRPDMTKSDVLASMKALSDAMRHSKAKNRVLFLASDMLENSSVTSFYGPGGIVRRVDTEKELANIQSLQMIGDFAGAKVVVLGAGLLSDDANNKVAYRDPRTMQALQSFWHSWFEQSNAQLIGFGKPALLTPLSNVLGLSSDNLRD